MLDGVDFPVIAGQIVALVGPNGAGKSTLLAALAGELELCGGSVALDGHALTHWTHLDMARRRAVLPQSHTVGFAFRAREVVAMGRAPWARTDRQDQDEAAIAAAMAATDVERFAERPFPALSGGESARVALARVLAQDTATLLLDEPTAALDLGHQEQVLRLARERASAGAAVVVVLHDLGVAAAYADRIAVLEAGRITADGPPRQILTPNCSPASTSIRSTCSTIRSPARNWCCRSAADAPAGRPGIAAPQSIPGRRSQLLLPPHQPQHPVAEPQREHHQPGRSGVQASPSSSEAAPNHPSSNTTRRQPVCGKRGSLAAPNSAHTAMNTAAAATATRMRTASGPDTVAPTRPPHPARSIPAGT